MEHDVRASLRPLLLLAAALGLGACVSPSTSPLSWYPTQSARAPQNLNIGICHAFGCQRQTQVQLTQSDVDHLAGIMQAGQGSAQAERAAVKQAVMWMEKRVGPFVGSDDDVGGLDLQNSGVPGQMDCLDETTNTTTTLIVLAENGLLDYHAPAHPVARGFFLDGRYPHATAVLRETASGEDWAIDPWPYANGVDVDVMPLDEWYATWPYAG